MRRIITAEEKHLLFVEKNTEQVQNFLMYVLKVLKILNKWICTQFFCLFVIMVRLRKFYSVNCLLLVKC